MHSPLALCWRTATAPQQKTCDEAGPRSNVDHGHTGPGLKTRPAIQETRERGRFPSLSRSHRKPPFLQVFLRMLASKQASSEKDRIYLR